MYNVKYIYIYTNILWYHFVPRPHSTFYILYSGALRCDTIWRVALFQGKGCGEGGLFNNIKAPGEGRSLVISDLTFGWYWWLILGNVLDILNSSLTWQWLKCGKCHHSCKMHATRYLYSHVNVWNKLSFLYPRQQNFFKKLFHRWGRSIHMQGTTMNLKLNACPKDDHHITTTPIWRFLLLREKIFVEWSSDHMYKRLFVWCLRKQQPAAKVK